MLRNQKICPSDGNLKGTSWDTFVQTITLITLITTELAGIHWIGLTRRLLRHRKLPCAPCPVPSEWPVNCSRWYFRIDDRYRHNLILIRWLNFIQSLFVNSRSEQRIPPEARFPEYISASSRRTPIFSPIGRMMETNDWWNLLDELIPTMKS